MLAQLQKPTSEEIVTNPAEAGKVEEAKEEPPRDVWVTFVFSPWSPNNVKLKLHHKKQKVVEKIVVVGVNLVDRWVDES